MATLARFVRGDRVGHYEIVREVAPGAYEATHQVLPRRALVKVARGSAALQLMREACILEALHHPGISKVFESGRLADGRPWFAQELVAGESLAAVLGRGSLRAVETVTLVAGLAEILEHAHRRGVVHRALQPGRVTLAQRRPCIVDWSEARAHDAARSIPHVPAPGSHAYVAPEIARGDVTDDRADVFSLGAIAYQALTGALPSPHVSVAQGCGNAPPELVVLIDQMLAADRFDRPTASEVRADLVRLAAVLATQPPEHVVLVDTEGVPELPPLRIRRPRWTPQVSYVASDLADLVSGEIEL